MSFLVIVICLLVERFLAQQISIKRFSWFSHAIESIHLQVQSIAWLSAPVVTILLAMVPIVFVTSGVLWVVHDWLFGMVSMVLNVLILFYCLGPMNVFYPPSSTGEKDAIGDYLVQSNEQLFGVLFWYMALGPVGALVYRLLSLCKQSLSLNHVATLWFDVLDWIPVRLCALFYLLVGNFQQGFPVFLSDALSPPINNANFLRACGLRVLDSGRGEDISMGHAQTLVEHALLLWLFLLAIYSFIV